MKNFLMFLIAACILFAAHEGAFAQKKKKDKTKKSKISVHGEKDNNGVYNQRKNTVNEGTAGRSKKKKGKKAKRDTGLILSPKSNSFYVFYKREDNSESSFA